MRGHLVYGFILLGLALPAVLPAATTCPAVPLQGAITLDGQLNEPGWAAAQWQTNFLSASDAAEAAGAPKPIAVQTRFKVLYDQAAVYVGVECDEPLIDQLKARYSEHDDMVFMDDCVELFFDPAGEGRYYHHFIINSKGAWYDDYGADYGLVHVKLWDFPLEVGTAVDREAKKWRLEVRIPLAGLVLKEDAGPNWLWNVTRERYATGTMELSTWAPLKGNFHQPRLFGKLTGMQVDYRRFALSLGEPRVAVSGGDSGVRNVSLGVTVSSDLAGEANVVTSAEVFLQPKTRVSAPAVKLPRGGKAEVTLPVLKVPAALKTAPVQLTVADATSGEPLKIVVKRLDAEYRPVSIEVLEPVYRQNIYATQKVPQLVFRVTLAGDVAERAAQVVYSLQDAAGKSVREGKAPLAALKDPLRLEVGTLPTGVYALQVRALDRGDGTIVEQQTTIRKLPAAPGSEVRVDEKRNILVNGKPVVFLGWYGDVPLEDPRADVVALQNIKTPVVLNGADPSEVREAYEKHGIYSVVSIEPGRLHYTFSLWRDPKNTVAKEPTVLSEPSEETLGYFKQLVQALQGEPGLLGWYLADEPEINNTRSDYLEAVHRVMQELDPYHPVMITNDTLDGIVTHGYKACDILNPDPYSSAWDYVPNFLKRVLEVAPRGKGTMLTPWHSAADTHFNREPASAPPYSYRVMRHQFLVGVALGSRGYTGYTTAFYMPEIELRYGLPPIWREIRFLESAMAQPADPPQVQSDTEMAAWLGQANGQVYLVVVNHKPGTRQARISHPLLSRVSRLDVVAEGRSVTVQGGAFRDTFAEGDARIYTTDPAGRKLPTTKAVEADLAAHKAASAKPGNLLHVSRGVRARASEGFYAPWFSQYYYYALNGITDDEGWYLTHAGGKPSWLEITLPAAAPVARVVLYTPNLADYDLQFQGPDGTVQVAEVRGNTESVASHTFNPPVNTLKLRVTALATRPSEFKGGMVREIEAYSTAGSGTPTTVRLAQAPQAIDFQPAASETEGNPVLWREDFTNFQSAAKFNWDGKDDKWVLNAEALRVAPKTGGGALIQSLAPVGYASMSHFYPYDPAYRFYQAKINAIEGDGYRWTGAHFGSGSGKPDYRGAINTSKPGIWTVDTHYTHESFRRGEAKQAYVQISATGSGKNADGTGKPGPVYHYDWLQLVRRPQNGLIVTLADGSPLPEVLKEGDELLYRVYLDKPALDVAVEATASHTYSVVPINREPTVQLLKIGSGEGREWAAKVKLGPGTGKVDASQGYPVAFRAVITGGELAETFFSAFLKFE